MRMIALDTETTGVDFYHGAKPFLVTIARDDGEVFYWEWEVDPENRQPKVPASDLDEIRFLLLSAQRIVGQNTKFDIAALRTLGIVVPWEKVDDTLLAGHLLASNRPHDLTSMALFYLNEDIQPYEARLKEALLQARRIAKGMDWRIATQGDPHMPSAKESTWKFDLWLPRQLYNLEPETTPESWKTITADYANTDSAVTLELWKVFERLLEKRKLLRIYQERRKVLPIAHTMEREGVTISRKRQIKLLQEYREESSRLGRVMVSIASSLGKELRLPKSGNNKSLLECSVAVLNEGFRRSNAGSIAIPRTEKGSLSLNKAALRLLQEQLPERSKYRRYFEALEQKRRRDTAITYMEAYRRFWLPLGKEDTEEWFLLHPQLNPTGTDTLRWSSNNPNEQNISKQEGFNLRYCFGPAPGREWWSLDAKNIELRLPAYESGEKELIELFEHPDDPPYYGSTHLLNFHTVYPDIWEKELREVGREKVGPHCKKKYAATWYQWCKNGGFAVQYGAVLPNDPRQWGTADRAFHRLGSHARLKERFGKLEALNRKCIDLANRFGYVETIPDRTVDPERGYPLLCTRTEFGKILETVPLNYHIQGSAMWWTMKAMLRVQEKLNEWKKLGFDGRITMQVHDELVLDFPKGGDPVAEAQASPGRNGKKSPISNLWRIRVIQQLMAKGGELDFGIPTPVGCEYHPDNWSEGITL
jgi:DNA polymerase I-like protein with 3'-5' exonuclease and polymerase domains